MFEYVVQNQELIPEEERIEIFGRFKDKPHLLSIPPGLESDFQVFLSAVENLVPTQQTNKKGSKKNKRNNRNRISTETPSSSASKSESMVEQWTKETKTKPSIDLLIARVKKAVMRESREQKIQLCPEILASSFEISNSGHNFKFQCNKVGCKKIVSIAYSDLTNEARTSNAIRHAKDCVLGVGRSSVNQKPKQKVHRILHIFYR